MDNEDVVRELIGLAEKQGMCNRTGRLTQKGRGRLHDMFGCDGVHDDWINVGHLEPLRVDLWTPNVQTPVDDFSEGNCRFSWHYTKEPSDAEIESFCRLFDIVWRTTVFDEGDDILDI